MTVENEFFGSEDLRPPTGQPPSGPDPDESQAVNRSTMQRPSLPALLSAGLRGLRRYPGLAAVLYLVQVALSAGAALVAMMMLVTAFGERPLFDRAMDGDVAALVACFRGQPGLLLGLFWIGVAAIALYGVVSWFLTAGLIAVFLDVPSRRREVARWFGSAGASNFFPFMRLALWSVLPGAAVLAVAGVGFVWVRDRLDQALSMGGLLEALAIGLSPGLLLHWITATAIDYARIDLVRHPGLSSLRALMRGFRLVAHHRLALVHTLLYGVVFIGVTALYDWMTVGGAMSLLGLVVVRQISSLVRFAAHFGLIAGQVELGCTTMGTPLARRR
jgi:hypothetical protein